MPLADCLVGEIMTRHPETVEVFVQHRMACPGCWMAHFMTVADAALEYGIDERALVAALDEAIARAGDAH